MIATMQPTGKFEKFMGVDCRLWRGTTDKGTQIVMFVPCIMADAKQDQPDLERELRQIQAERQLVSFDTRLL